MPLVYLAAPIQLYESQLYDDAYLEAVNQGLDVGDVRRMYRGNADWLDRWPRERHLYDAIWLITDGDWIGRGMDTELADMRAASRPAWWWNRSTDAFTLGPTTTSWRRWRQLIPE